MSAKKCIDCGQPKVKDGYRLCRPCAERRAPEKEPRT